ncbi:MAG: hypothetical protein B7Y80_09265 [Hyphomicrobium sp. 32-62-53]|nr:MAG: hypothetical protein B7Z29_09355 [Hyphomicrobium sp. 12-62-95]OYY00081.1 MAG: hypothetical protein B7Y80_09265 [Hyphomicrobium sp. 32-62-53]
MEPTVITRFAVIAAATLALAGCGESEEAKIETKRYIVVSAIDCADNTGLDYDRCVKLLQTAVAQHDKTAATYPKLEACESTEGEGRCERAGEKTYRARVTAFQLTIGAKTAAVPLYAPTTNKAGLRTAANDEILPDAETITFTESAADASHFYFKEDPNKRKKRQ